MKKFVRFFIAAGIGFLIDMALAMALHELAGLVLWLAATISYFVVAACNYVLFEFWVFRDRDQDFSMKRLIGVILASAVAAGARIGTIILLAPLAIQILGETSLADLALLICGGGASILVNFGVNQTFVFRQTKTEQAGG